MEQRDLDKLRNRGLTTSTSHGVEAVRVTAQNAQSLTDVPRQERRRILERWERDVERVLGSHGAEVVAGSLSVLGQTVEAVVPIDSLDPVTAALGRDGVRIDVMIPRRGIEPP